MSLGIVSQMFIPSYTPYEPSVILLTYLFTHLLSITYFQLLTGHDGNRPIT